MGGCDFANTGKGRSAAEVFKQLQDDALYESGHGGYSGTIAEKHGFHPIPQPSQDTLRATLTRQLEHSKKQVEYATNEVAKYASEANGYWLKNSKERLEEATKNVRELEAKLANKDPIIADRDLLHSYADWYESEHPNEKWGAAYCLTIKEPDAIKPMGKAKALTLAQKKYGETAEVTVKTERANKDNGHKKTVYAFISVVSKSGGWGVNTPVPGGYRNNVKNARAEDEKTALGMLFTEEGEFYFFGCASC